MIKSIGIEKARLYEKYRLPYSREIVNDLLKHVTKTELLVDLGAGTGQLARLFADHFNQICAIEPDQSMTQIARDVFRDYPHINVINAFAEETTLSENSVDLIVIGNAFHRFKQEAIEEILRILNPSGWVAVVSYTFTNKHFTDMLFGKLSMLKNLTARTTQAWQRIPVKDLFGSSQIHTLNYPQSLLEDWETFWGAARSGIEAPQPNEDDFDRFMKINKNVFDTLSINNQIRIDYETTVLFGQPKSQTE